jgi:hypothetical protein
MKDVSKLSALNLTCTHESPIKAGSLNLKALQNRFSQKVMNFTDLSGGVAVHYTCGKFMQSMQVF